MIESIVLGDEQEIKQLLSQLFVGNDSNLPGPFNVDAPVKKLLFDWDQSGSSSISW